MIFTVFAMPMAAADTLKLIVFITPYFNIAATTSFIDPFRVTNYLTGRASFSWHFVSLRGGEVHSSSGLSVQTEALTEHANTRPGLVLVSSSWSPEGSYSDAVTTALQRWLRSGAAIGGLDTGAFILANAGLLDGKRATVHYEHIDALEEIAVDTTVTEDLFVVDQRVFTCCGGTAATDASLHFIMQYCGRGLANAVARYLFHHHVRGVGVSQNPQSIEPMGHLTPVIIRRAIDLMEAHLEDPLTIPHICQELGVSQRQLGRLFRRYVRKSAVEYYRDIRLDRARGLVTQTEMKLSEVAAASGFNSQVHFSRAYRQRFGLTPSTDRIEGRVPFEFRAWPMHDPNS